MIRYFSQHLKRAFFRLQGAFSRRGGPAKTLLIFVLTIIVALFIAGFIPVNLPFVPAKISSAVENTMGGSCKIEKVTVALWSGFRVSHISLKTPANREKVFDVTVPQVRVGFRLLPLLFKHLRLHELVVDKPVAVVRVNPAKAAPPHPVPPLPKNAPAPKAPARASAKPAFLVALPGLLSGFSFSLGTARVKSGAFTLTSGGNPLVEAVDIDVSASLSSLSAGEAEISVGRIKALDSWEIRDFLIKCRLKGATANVDRMEASLYGGHVTGEGSYDLASAKIDTFDLNVKHLDIGPFYEDMKNRQGRFKGKADMSVHLGHCASSPESMSGRGIARIIDFSVEEVPAQKLAQVKVLMPLFKKLVLEKVDADFTLKHGKITTDRVDGTGKLYDVHASGWIGFDAMLNEDVKVTLTEAMVPQFAQFADYAFIRGPDGRYVMLFNVSNTFSEPVITIDNKIVQHTVKKLLFEAGKSLGRFLKKN
jgi:hypothetical protein